MDLNIWLSENNKQLNVFVENLEISAATWMKKGIHPGYTDHTIDHSKRVLEYLGKLVAPLMSSDNPLSEIEVCLLIAAAYTHDTGMQDQREMEVEEIRDKHHILSGAINREISRQIISQTLAIIPEPFPGIFDRVALIAEGHRKIDLTNSKFDSVNVSGEQIQIRFLAVLLRLADELDMDYRRAPLAMTQLQNYPPETLIHWFKSYYVSGIKIQDDQITIHYQFPYNKGETYFRIFDRIVGDKIRQVLGQLYSILYENGIRTQMNDPHMSEYEGILDLPTEVWELAVKEAHEMVKENRVYKKITEDIAFYESMSRELATSPRL